MGCDERVRVRRPGASLSRSLLVPEHLCGVDVIPDNDALACSHLTFGVDVDARRHGDTAGADAGKAMEESWKTLAAPRD